MVSENKHRLVMTLVKRCLKAQDIVPVIASHTTLATFPPLQFPKATSCNILLKIDELNLQRTT